MPVPPTDPIQAALRLTQALNLARRGRLREAEAGLCPGGVVPRDPLTLQAVAALATAGRDYPRALQLWRLLGEVDPGNAEAWRMVQAIQLWQQRPAWMNYAGWIGGALGLAALAVLVLVLL